MAPAIFALVAAATPDAGGPGGPHTLYNLVMFVHIIGAIGLFVAIAIEILVALRMRRAGTTAQLREWGAPSRAMYYLHLATTPLIVATGLTMMALQAGFTTAWIDISLVAMLCLSASGLWVSRTRLTAIERAARGQADGPVPAPLGRRIADPLLLTTAQTQFVVGLGILYLMVLKPESWLASALAILVAAAIGAGATPITRRAAVPRALPA